MSKNVGVSVNHRYAQYKGIATLSLYPLHSGQLYSCSIELLWCCVSLGLIYSFHYHNFQYIHCAIYLLGRCNRWRGLSLIILMSNQIDCPLLFLGFMNKSLIVTMSMNRYFNTNFVLYIKIWKHLFGFRILDWIIILYGHII